MLPYKVRGKYESLIEALSKVGTDADCGEATLPKPVASCFHSAADPSVVEFDCVFYLKSWRWKGVSKSERINILVHAKEYIQRADQVLLKSTVCVNYFTGPADAPILLQAFHYDFDPEPADHPLFHMQVTNRCIALTAEAIASLEVRLPAGDAQPVLRCARVPTCDMTLASVLLCLAADHVGGTIFIEFLKKICELQADLPQPAIELLRNNLGSPVRNVRSSHWFRPPPLLATATPA